MAEEAPDYSWITSEMFENKLTTLVEGMSTAELMTTPGISEILREELNNDIIIALENERGQKR